jgi:hypothetical protein
MVKDDDQYQDSRDQEERNSQLGTNTKTSFQKEKQKRENKLSSLVV